MIIYAYAFGISGKVNDVTRVEKIIQQTGLQSGEAVMLSKPSNIFYASGYTGEGIALIAHDLCAIVTDFRYTEQAGRQAPAFKAYEIKTGQSHYALADELLHDHHISTVRFEADEVTVAGFEQIKRDMAGMTFSALHGEVEKVRRIKEDCEIALIEEACDISVRAFEKLLGMVREGMTEQELRIALDFEMLKLGGDGNAFDTIVASGENGSLCHAVPGSRKLRRGDMVTLDFGAKKGGYCADMTRTFALGQPSAEMKKIYDVVLQAQNTAQDALHAGLRGCDVDKIARDIIDNAGYKGCFGHGLGHSVGIDIHESPRLSATCTDVLEENVTMTVEPGIYVAGLGGVRIENTCVIGRESSRTLVHAPKELIIL